MTEGKDGCNEETCVFFNTLSSDAKELNRKARKAVEGGEEFPGLLITTCGECMRQIIIAGTSDRTLEEMKKRLGS